MYAFHMPAFFFVSGLFLVASLAKHGTSAFLRGRAAVLLWPYVLFEIVFMVLSRLIAHHKGTPVPGWSSAAWTFFTAKDAWFLPTLFFALAVFALLRRVPLLFLLLASLAVRSVCLRIPVNFVAAGLFFLPFVVLGAISAERVQMVAKVPRWLCALLALLLGWTVWFATGKGWQFRYAEDLLLGILGTVMLLLTAHLLERTATGRWLAWCGQASLGIFLIAPYPQVLVRTLLLKLHLTEAALQLALPSFAAVLLGAWMYHHRERLHVRWLFRFPQRVDH